MPRVLGFGKGCLLNPRFQEWYLTDGYRDFTEDTAYLAIEYSLWNRNSHAKQAVCCRKDIGWPVIYGGRIFKV